MSTQEGNVRHFTSVCTYALNAGTMEEVCAHANLCICGCRCVNTHAWLHGHVDMCRTSVYKFLTAAFLPVLFFPGTHPILVSFLSLSS